MILVNPPFPEERAFIAVLMSWFISQFLKLIRGGIKEKRLSLKWLFNTGGMPSSHSATVSCLATVTGLYYGLNSVLFLAVGIFSIVTMFDAAGVRRAVGKQARILNNMVDEIYETGEFKEDRLKELLGHTPVEVFAGAFLGVIIGVVFCKLEI